MEIDLITYVELVEKMRETQNEYFRTKSTNALNRAKILEKAVDEITANVLAPGRITNQQSLF